MFGAGALLAIYGFLIEPGMLTVRRERLEVPNWRGEVRVAAISDLHTGAPYVGLEKIRRVVELTNAERPDLILLLGDFVIGGATHEGGVLAGSFIPPEDTAAVLKDLRAPLGVFSVLGNHDGWFDGPRVARALESAGIPVFDNHARRMEHAGGAFWIGGIADYWTGTPAIDSTLRETDPSEPVLLFTHNPDVFPGVPPRVSLTIAGHTHGGQVAIPLIGTPIVPSQRGYNSGLFVEQGRHMFITSGVGTSIIPVRFRVRPEIAILTVAAASGGH